jgi:hypothetical protein
LYVTIVSTGHTGVNRDVRTINQTAPTQYQEIPSFPDDLEVIIANIECRLLDTLTPQQFMMVQDLMEATRMLTEAELTLGQDILSERKSA